MNSSRRLRTVMLPVLRLWDRVSIYLPVMLMGVLALATYWLVRNTPTAPVMQEEAPLSHDPDYTMRVFSVKSYDANGRLKSEVFGAAARHYPDTDTLEVDQVRVRAVNPAGQLSAATADRALTNGDGSEVQLFGNAVVIREAGTDANGRVNQRFEFRGEFLHAWMDAERVRSHLPVTLIRGQDRVTADTLDFDNLDQILDMRGRVHAVMVPAVVR